MQYQDSVVSKLMCAHCYSSVFAGGSLKSLRFLIVMPSCRAADDRYGSSIPGLSLSSSVCKIRAKGSPSTSLEWFVKGRRKSETKS